MCIILIILFKIIRVISFPFLSFPCTLYSTLHILPNTLCNNLSIQFCNDHHKLQWRSPLIVLRPGPDSKVGRAVTSAQRGKIVQYSRAFTWKGIKD